MVLWDENAVRCIQRVEERAQHTALCGPCDECQSRGEMPAHPDWLWSICQVILNPKTEVLLYTQVEHLGKQSTGRNGVEHGAVVHEQQPCICPLLFQVAQYSVEDSGGGVVCWTVGYWWGSRVGGRTALMCCRTSLSRRFMMTGVSATGL